MNVEALLLEGLDSGEKIEISDEWWEKKREELRERLRQEKS
jgi:antitoxin ParD1/3/4